MSTCAERDASPVQLALAGGIPQRVGWYRYHFDDERWEWSPRIEAKHGREAGTVCPTDELVRRHRHPDDREMVTAALRELRRTHLAFSTRPRIVSARTEIREMLVIVERLEDGAGKVKGAQGFYIDVTPDPASTDEAITEAVSEIAENRAVIEQVKGVLRLVYRIDADAAFALLKWRSQDSNVKLRTLAEQLMTDFEQLEHDGTLPPRSTFDHLLLTAHERVSAQPT